MEFKEKTAEELANMTAEEQAIYTAKRTSHLIEEVKKSVDALRDGSLSKEDYELKEKQLRKSIAEDFDGKAREELKDELAKQKQDLIKTQLELKEIKSAAPAKPSTLTSFLKNFFSLDGVKSYVNKPNGKSERYGEKTVSIGSDYLGGTVLITQDTGRRIVPVERPINMRDIMMVEKTDLPYLVFAKITGWVNAIDMLAENTTLPESSFDVTEATVNVKRLGTFIDISKNMLKSVTWVISRINSILPKKMRWIEDFQILFGDGAGNNLDGLMPNARTFDAADISFAATSVASVASYNGGAGSLVTFAAAHNLFNGYNITIANSTNYNATHVFVVKSATQILLPNTAYNAEATAAWTAIANHAFKDEIVDANEYDALHTTLSDAKTQWYTATGIVANPMDATKMELLKSTTARYLGVIERRNGILFVNNVPVVETDAMPVGEFLVGDFDSAVSLVDYQSLEIYLADDVSYIKDNQVAVIVEEQVLLPIFNSLMFVRGNYATIIANINKP